MLCLPSSVAFARDATVCLLGFTTTDYLYYNVESGLKPFIYTAGSWSAPKVILICISLCKGTVVGRRCWATASLNCSAFFSGNCYKENVFFLLTVLPNFSLPLSL